MLTRAAALAAPVAALAACLSALPATAAPSPAAYCAAAQRLAKVAPGEAKQALAKAVVGAPCPAGVAALTPPATSPGTMKRVEDFVAAWSKVIGVVTGAALIGFLLLAALFSLATHSRRVRRTLRYVPILGRLFQPSVTVTAFDGSVLSPHGVDVSSITGLALRRMSSDGGSVGLDVVTGAESFGDTVAKLGDVAPQFKALGEILGFITTTAAWPRYQLGGTIQQNGGRGIGLALALDRKQRAVDGNLLVPAATGPAGANDAAVLETLAVVAAGWTEYAVRKDETPDGFDYNARPRSYAYLRAGAVLEYFGHRAEAVIAYRQAVIEDETNPGALTNLGRIVGREGHRDTAEVLLKAALLALEPTP